MYLSEDHVRQHEVEQEGQWVMADQGEPVGVGDVVSLAPLGLATTGRVVSRSWSPALGRILRVLELDHGRAGPMLLLYGEALDRLLRGRGPTPQDHPAA